MPGMMDTVLNLGLNDETVEGLAKLSGDRASPMTAIAASSRCIPNVVLELEHGEFEDILDDSQGSKGYHLDTEMTADDWKAIVANTRRAVEKKLGKPFPQDPKRSALGRDRRGVRSWMNDRAITYRRLHDIPGKLGHGRQRAGDGVRQHGRNVGHRRCLHARSLDRRRSLLRRVPDQRAGRGRGRRHPHAAASPRRARARRARSRQSLEEAMPEVFAS
jgi:pyruvate,orthophosphate dikinase